MPAWSDVKIAAWLSLFVLPAETLRWDWKRFRHAFVHVAAKVVTGARMVVARLAESHRLIPQLLAASKRLDALVFR